MYRFWIGFLLAFVLTVSPTWAGEYVYQDSTTKIVVASPDFAKETLTLTLFAQYFGDESTYLSFDSLGVQFLNGKTITQNLSIKLESGRKYLKEKEALETEIRDKLKNKSLNEAELNFYLQKKKELDLALSKSKLSKIITISIEPQDENLNYTVKVNYHIESQTEAQISVQSVSGTLSASTATPPKPTRTIIFIIDALGKDLLYSHLDELPNINNYFFNDGVDFTDTVVTFPSITIPSHATILTGVYPSKHGIPALSWQSREDKTICFIDEEDWVGCIPGYGYVPDLSKLHLGSDPNTNLLRDTILEEGKRNIGGHMFSALEKVYDRDNNDNIDHTGWLDILDISESYFLDRYKEGDKEVVTNIINDELAQGSYPGIFVVWLPGVDLARHDTGPYSAISVDTLKGVDAQVGRLIEDLQTRGIYEETLLVLTADHGQTEVTQPQIMDDFASYTESQTGYSIVVATAEGYAYETDDVVIRGNGEMSHIYVLGDSGDWAILPNKDEPRVQNVLDAIKSYANSYGGIDEIFVRTSSGYELVQDYGTPYTDYPDAETRLEGQFSDRAGDILVTTMAGYSFNHPSGEGDHGSFRGQDSYVPLLFHGPGIRNDSDSTLARTVDIAPTIANLLGFSMPNADGIVLPVKEEEVPITPCADESCPLPDTTAPTIYNTRHDPASPSSSDSIHVYADVIDDTNVSSAVVWYTADGSNWQKISLTNTGGDTWRTITPIPAQASGTEIQYTVCATDGSGNNACEEQAVCPLSQELAGIMEQEENASLEIDLSRTFRLSADAEYYASQEACSIGVHTIIVGVVDNTPPGTPTLYDPGGTLNEGEYYVMWSNVGDAESGVKHYELQESDSPTFQTTSYYTTSTSYLITGKGSGTHYYRVRAIDNADNPSSWSNTQDVIIDIPPVEPPAPPAPSWSAIDSFDDESGTAYGNGWTWGDWRYEELLDDGVDNYVRKESSFEGRYGVGLFYWGTTLGDEAPQAIEKSNPAGWDFSYSEGEWAVMMNNRGPWDEYVQLYFWDVNGREAATYLQSSKRGAGWEQLVWDSTLILYQAMDADISAMEIPEGAIVAQAGFQWNNVSKVKLWVEKSRWEVVTNHIGL